MVDAHRVYRVGPKCGCH